MSDIIFVTLGTDNHPFDRLLREVDRLVENKEIKGKVVAQTGNSTYKPKNYEYFRFTTFERIHELNEKAKIIISHAGAGSVITAFKYKKPLILVPRLKEFDEHTDNHQIQIAVKFAKERKAVAVLDIEDLGKALKRVKKPVISRKNNKVLDIIRDFLEGYRAEA